MMATVAGGAYYLGLDHGFEKASTQQSFPNPSPTPTDVTATIIPTPTPDPALQRDLDRQRDTLYLWKAMEVNKNINSSTYTALSFRQFASGKIPTDPVPGNVYCAISPASTTNLAAWTKDCPSGWSPIREGSLGGAKSWTVCAWLEKTGAQYCKSNY